MRSDLVAGKRVIVRANDAIGRGLSLEWEDREGQPGEVWRVTTQIEAIQDPGVYMLQNVGVILTWRTANAEHTATIDANQTAEIAARALSVDLSWPTGSAPTSVELPVNVSVARGSRGATAPPLRSFVSNTAEVAVPAFARRFCLVAGLASNYLGLVLRWMSGPAGSGGLQMGAPTHPEPGVWYDVPRWCPVLSVESYPVALALRAQMIFQWEIHL